MVWQDVVSMDGNKLSLRGKGGKEYTFYVKEWNAKLPIERVQELVKSGEKISVNVDMDMHIVTGAYHIRDTPPQKEEVQEERTPMDDLSERFDGLINEYLGKGMGYDEIFVVLRDKLVDLSDKLLEERKK